MRRRCSSCPQSRRSSPVPAARSLPGALKTELHASVVELTTDVERHARSRRSSGWSSCAAQRGTSPSATVTSSRQPARIRRACRPSRRSLRSIATATSSSTQARRRAGRASAACTSTSACPTPRPASASWRRSCPGCRSCSRSPRTRRTSRARDTGMLSIRAEVLGLLPRHGAPPAFRDYAEWERFIERMAETGLASDYTSFWWDVRPHPRFGTLEIRTPDQATVDRVHRGALVRCIQALCAWALDCAAARRSTRASAASTTRTAGPRRASVRTASSSIPIATRRSRVAELAARAA